MLLFYLTSVRIAFLSILTNISVAYSSVRPVRHGWLGLRNPFKFTSIPSFAVVRGLLQVCCILRAVVHRHKNAHFIAHHAPRMHNRTHRMWCVYVRPCVAAGLRPLKLTVSRLCVVYRLNAHVRPDPCLANSRRSQRCRVTTTTTTRLVKIVRPPHSAQRFRKVCIFFVHMLRRGDRPSSIPHRALAAGLFERWKQ